MSSDRREAIIRIIQQHVVGTQQQLTELLEKEGYDVTQATVSRDIKKLGLTKAQVKGGGQKYIAPRQTGELGTKYVNVLREGFVSADTAGNILVIKTVSGMAMAVAAAVDAMEFEQVVGSIAGDDTIMVAIRSGEAAEILRHQLESLVTGQA